MAKNWVIGFPRIGEQRELKKALESYWAGDIGFEEVKKCSKTLRKRHWQYQKDNDIEYISCNDFSLYDNMLDMSIVIGAIPKRFRDIENEEELYFSMARGNKNSTAMSMTKWLNTNYHYIVPELSKDDEYSLNIKKIKEEYFEAKEFGIKPKINLIGIVSYIAFSKAVDFADRFEAFGKIIQVYEKLLKEISKFDDEIIVQFDEPYFVKDISAKELSLLKIAYDRLSAVAQNIKIAVVTYFEHSKEATKVLASTDIWAIGLDFVYGSDNIDSLDVISQSDKVLIAGVIDGRNIWVSDIEKKVSLLKAISKKLNKENIIVSTSCSLLHVPITLKYEKKLACDIKDWIAFGVEKLAELRVTSNLFFGSSSELSAEDRELLSANKRAIHFRATSNKIHNFEVFERLKNIDSFNRDLPFEKRIKIQKDILSLPILPTTTIGSFPQTAELRKLRRDYKNKEISKDVYERGIKSYIDECIACQEECGLDVLVHGEPERNDMVEYFGEMLEGFAFSQNGWVQSYGSRCVKPPLLYGDVSRPNAMTVEWITYAQSKTEKPVKGMLTGPVTILNWSFVRDDQPKDVTAKQIALSIADEIDDLQKEGIKIVQVDEAAFKEGYPLRKEKIGAYEKWAIESFKLATAVAEPKTQIHTHMCYSDFNDIIDTIEAMDADVITIETSRSGNRLLKVFKRVGYKKEIGPGVYDIHSPRVPTVEEIKEQIGKLLEVLPKEQLWINPDCGLKTRKWEEVKPSLKNMVQAVKSFR
ncbi:MAG: 5-methyltetrahydropteroyltriglutamate--homocysteine S-methyltransferase [Epsilonproteobacteria bacterium]|nr:5-methyltetrahydropteroyltriglutamate--homocysteine S-methyltransferase [Campylobacterota bacterium]